MHYNAQMVKLHRSPSGASVVDTGDVPIDNAKIRRLREELKLSQTEAAKRAGLPSHARWSKIETGTVKNITIETLERIAKVLGVKARDLLK